jgi:hypothetical protein
MKHSMRQKAEAAPPGFPLYRTIKAQGSNAMTPILRWTRTVLLVTCATLIGGFAAAATPVGAYAPDQLIVRFKPGTAAQERIAARLQLDAEESTPFEMVAGLELLKLRHGADVFRAVESLSRNPNVMYAEPDFVMTANVIPNDPYYSSQWGLIQSGAEGAWDSGAQNAPSMVVAIIDTGIQMTHPDLLGNIWVNPGETPGDGIDNDKNGYIDDVNGWDFAYGDNNPTDGNGHGTHVAGIVGAAGNNVTGTAGVMWRVKLMALKFLDDSGSGLTSNAVKAVQYATKKGVLVSNNSWGGGSYSQALYDAINASRSVGHVFVAAAGNDGRSNDSVPKYPASYTLDNIISVAAIDRYDNKASFSNFGVNAVDLGAPGVSVTSTYLNSGYSDLSGTSMAAPHVAGAAALLYNMRPWWKYGTVRNALLNSVVPLAQLAGKVATGGRLDVGRAADAASRTPTPGQPGFKPPLKVLAHVQSIGDMVGREDEWVGTKGRALRLEGFSVNALVPAYTPNVQLEYMCHLQGLGDSTWKPEGAFCGTRGQARRLEGLAIRLKGSAALDYSVVYYCHVQGYGDQGPYQDGAFCGTRGQTRRVEAIDAYLVRK